MKTDIYTITGHNSEDIEAVKSSVEKVATYKDLNKDQTMRLMLLAEELIGMEKGILGFNQGEFYIESDKLCFKICLHIEVDIDLDTKDRFVAMSKEQKNEAYKGFKGLIRFVTDSFTTANDSELIALSTYTANGPAITYFAPCEYEKSWVYSEDGDNTRKNLLAWDELEHSILLNFADDIIIGARNNTVDIVIVKDFSEDK